MTETSLVSCTTLLLFMVHISFAWENSTEGVSCEDYDCKSNYECVMIDSYCDTPPCGRTPACLLNCNGTQCVIGSACQNGQCTPYKEPFFDICVFFFCSPGLHCSRGKCTAGPLCEGIKCGQEEECHVVERKVCDALECDHVLTPVCEVSDSTGDVRLIHYILGIAILYIFLMTNFCVYLAFKRCRRKRQIQPSSD